MEVLNDRLLGHDGSLLGKNFTNDPNDVKRDGRGRRAALKTIDGGPSPSSNPSLCIESGPHPAKPYSERRFFCPCF